MDIADDQEMAARVAAELGVSEEFLEELVWEIQNVENEDGVITAYRIVFNQDSDPHSLAAIGLREGETSISLSPNIFDQEENEEIPEIFENPQQELERISKNISISDILDTRSERAKRWTRLSSITVKNFKATAEAKIPMDRVTILVGPNSCGKSSVLQAIHWAARSASYVFPKNQKEMISFDRLDYVPSSEPLKTLHNGELKTGSSTSAVEVAFEHQDDGPDQASVEIKLRAARNKGGITVYMSGGNAVTPYKQRFQFITAYIPGLAGLSEKETILAQPTLRRQAASGDAGGVLRNILFNLASDRVENDNRQNGAENLRQLNRMVQRIHPNMAVDVSFDDREDYHISATIRNVETGSVQPLETAATGYLQVVQIFAYLILFNPKVMLIDEPDAHLHPDKQERLIEALESASEELSSQIILSTHSPHMVRAAGVDTKLVWMQDGRVHTDDDEAIRRLLGWGGLDKSLLFFVEDEDDKAIRHILRQWPNYARRVSVCRCYGIENLPKDKLLEGLLVDGDLKVRALIHRDGDFMTDNEAQIWKGGFNTKGVFPWITVGTDIEGYFCSAEYLCAIYSVTHEKAEEWRLAASNLVSKAKDSFLQKRKQINYACWPNGGSPNSEELWNQLGGLGPKTVKGKKLHKALKVVVKQAGYDNRLLDKFTIPEGYVVAPDLHATLEAALNGY